MNLADIGYEVKESFQPNKASNHKYIALEHVDPDALHMNGFGSSAEVDSNKYYFKEGDILFGTLRPYFRKVILAPFDGVCSTEFAVVRPKRQEDRDFLFYSLANPKFIEFATTNSNGARPRTKWALFSKFEITELNENSREEVGRKLLIFDQLIENNKRRIELLEESARQLYNEWFVRFRFPGHEHVKIIDGVPEGWGKKKLKDLLTLNYGKALKADNRIPGDFPVYGSSGVVGSHNKALVKGPGIIVGRKGNVGAIHWSHLDFFPIDTVYFISAEESSYFIYYALLHIAFINTDVAVPGLNREFAYSREVIVPTDILRDEFEDEVAPIFKQCHTLEKYNDQLSKARDLLLPKLMNGEIAV